MSESRYPYLQWREVTPGRWERDIDEAERFYTQLAESFEGSGRMFFAITGFVSLSAQVQDDKTLSETQQRLEQALRKAWAALRHDHPTIASHVEYDIVQKKWIKSYTALNSATSSGQCETWLQETFVPVVSKVSGLDWCNADPVAPKVPTLFVIEPAIFAKEERIVRRDVVIRSPHDIMDGIGTLQVLNNLLQHAASHFENDSPGHFQSAGSEVQNLSPPLRVAAAIPPILTLDQQERLQGIVYHNTSIRKGVEVLTLPYKKGPVAPGKHQRIVFELSSADTMEVLESCKSVKATVTHVYHAAIAIAIRDLQKRSEHSRQCRYINYALVNERPKCKGAYSTPKHAATVYHSVSGQSLALDLTIPSMNDVADIDDNRKVFLSLVEQVRKHYHDIRDNPDDLALAPAFWSMGTPDLVDPTSSPNKTPIPAPNSSPSVSISSMGVLDKIIAPQHGPIKADKPWVTGEELGTGFGVFLGTWEGSLQLSLAYNDAWHDKDEAEGFLHHCHEIVWKGLGLGE